MYNSFFFIFMLWIGYIDEYMIYCIAKTFFFSLNLKVEMTTVEGKLKKSFFFLLEKEKKRNIQRENGTKYIKKKKKSKSINVDIFVVVSNERKVSLTIFPLSYIHTYMYIFLVDSIPDNFISFCLPPVESQGYPCAHCNIHIHACLLLYFRSHIYTYIFIEIGKTYLYI